MQKTNVFVTLYVLKTEKEEEKEDILVYITRRE